MFSKSFTWTRDVYTILVYTSLLGQMLPFCRFDCPFVAYETVEVTIERIQLWALYIFFLERNKS